MSGHLLPAALVGLCLSAPALAGADQFPTFTPFNWSDISERTRVASVVVVPGRFESCTVNPPIFFLTYGLTQSSEGGSPVFQPTGSTAGTAVVAALVGRGYPSTSEEHALLVLDELTISPGGVSSATGEVSKIFDQRLQQGRAELTPRTLEFSLCRFAGGSVSGRAWGILRGDVPVKTVWTAVAPFVAATSTWDIFGLDPDSYVRLRLSSEPAGANILLGGVRQPPQTNTILDVLAAEIPHLRLEKSGFEPCHYSQWKTETRRGSKRVLNATCKLEPRKKARNRR